MSRKKSRRAKFEGSLERHGRVWRARWTVNGRICTMSTGYGLGERSKAEAKLKEIMEPFKIQHEMERLKALESKIETREKKIAAYIDSLPAMSIMNAFAAYRKTHEGASVTAETAKMYESQFNRLIDWVKKHYPNVKELRQISDFMAKEFFEYLDDDIKVSGNTHNKYLFLFRAMWNALMRYEKNKTKHKSALTIPTAEESETFARLGEENPWNGVDSIEKVKSTPRRVLSEEELRMVLNRASGEFHTLFGLGIYTGMRLEDCACLEWSEVDFEKELIIRDPEKTKNSSGITVTIPLHRALLKILREIPAELHQGYVVPHCAVEYRHNRGEFCKKVNRVFDACGIQRQIRGEGRAKVVVGFHSLRHSFVSYCCERSIGSCQDSLEMVRQLIGHTNVKMTQHYNSSSMKSLQAVVDVLPNVLNEQQAADAKAEVGADKTAA